MKTYNISNEFLQVELSDMGGEMQSVKFCGRERLWCGNPDFWKYHAPFLFPIVGKFKDGKALIEGVECLMNQHGLSRLAYHDVVGQSEDSITFCFSSSRDTLACYPYEFDFFTRYTLIGKKIEIIITIKNKSGKTMFCSVGAHPAFPIDLHEGDSLDDYEIIFDKLEDNLTRMHANSDGLYCGEESCEPLQVVTKDEKSLNDTIIFRNFKSEYVSLIRKGTGEKVSAHLGGHEIVAFWKGAGAPFLCLEPWNCITDSFDSDGDFARKPYIEKIENEKSYDFSIIFE